MMLAGWGRYPRRESELLRMRMPAELPARVRGGDGVIARGAGRDRELAVLRLARDEKIGVATEREPDFHDRVGVPREVFLPQKAFHYRGG